jgi:hypothetical protein
MNHPEDLTPRYRDDVTTNTVIACDREMGYLPRDSGDALIDESQKAICQRSKPAADLIAQARGSSDLLRMVSCCLQFHPGFNKDVVCWNGGHVWDSGGGQGGGQGEVDGLVKQVMMSH